MQKERRVFGKICPNRIIDFSSRARKQPKDGTDKELSKTITSIAPLSVYIEDANNIADQAFATIAWQDLSDCTSVLQREADAPHRNNRLPDTTSFHLQEFKDAVESFIPEHPALLQPCFDAVSLQLPSCDMSAFQACIQSADSAQQELALPTPLHFTPPAQHVHCQPAPPLHPDHYWKDMADQNQKALGDALEVNNQLHATLSQKEEEIVSLQERNVQLKELANQAKHLASVLDRLMTRTKSTDENTDDLFQIKSGLKRRRLSDHYEQLPDCKEVDEILRDITDKCNAALHGDAKHPRLCRDERNSSGTPNIERIHMYGAFNGLQTSTTLSTSEMEEGMSFRTSIRDHCTIRTLAFPQGNAFTTRTNNGGYKFRWVPS
ncbi:multicilin isoform X2 [Polypterus senegalus]|uniref:multicilin isoform X2 n=1 Tax=Polypterus senegalus TaxID=55291 RepID=UPI0019632267|nr:multicilin isoform X2 [Polypterus senegalus]